MKYNTIQVSMQIKKNKYENGQGQYTLSRIHVTTPSPSQPTLMTQVKVSLS